MTVFGVSILAKSKVTKEEYLVYAGVVENNYANFKPNEFVTTIAILENTIEPNLVSLEKFLEQKRLFDYLYKATSSNEITPSNLEGLLKDFKETSKDPVRLKNQFPIEYNYSLITKGEIDKLLEDGKKEYAETLKKCKCLVTGEGVIWQPFHRKYRNSGGYYSFSRIGFSPDKKFALVYVNTESGDHGSSTFYVMEKVNSKWRVYKNFGGGWIT